MEARPENEKEADGRIYKLAIVAPTPFYYQVPIFRALSANPRIDCTTYYCSDEALNGRDIPHKFRVKALWGVEDDLLQGYKYKFLRNYAPRPSYLKSVTGLLNLGIWKALTKNEIDLVILMSWMNPTWWLALLACTLSRIPILYLTDQNIQRDLQASPFKSWLKRLFLGKLIFPLTAGFLCAGSANRELYRFYGVPDSKLITFAFSWGYETLLERSEDLASRRDQIRAELGIPEDHFVVLYVGRLSPEKRPLHLFQAYARIDLPNKALVVVGDGELRQTLENYTDEHHLDSVYFFGFQDRREVPKFYAIANLLVLPSDRETWGIVVNEALCFGLPVIVSDQVGALHDMVRHGENGFIFPRGDIAALARYIETLATMSQSKMAGMRAKSLDIIKTWASRDLGTFLVEFYDNLCSIDQGSAE